MAVEKEFLDHVLELFDPLGPLRVKRMFSGAGLFLDEDAMIAMISSSGTVYMKADDTTRPAFEAAGSFPFSYTRGEVTRVIPSWMALPESALDDPDEAMDWARRAVDPALAAAVEKRAEKARKAARKKIARR
ncbi:TfoX/Sxy family protein [Pseudooceanicola nanhaiensis]|uniref:TfoX/Sxy family protein n=1 Tax=Pseudooceanicola nanhaiensis TaxID=375761 RepID=UPI001CD35C33|nr:TfoX/Sxy family protein [Pseudooceanicola nanhaiensis]MCA0920908.1 TfoX/Sxy family protein [Pseudooceanicola nanhaiensis]